MENPQASLAHQFEELKRLQEATKKERDDVLKQIEELHRTKGGVINYTEFSRAELEVATNNFDKSLVIGKGGFATVYKGFLRHTTVAIKILDPKKYQVNIEKEFNLEVEILTKVRHPNLVSLIGSSMEAWALIYEFLPNGSLDAYLTNETGSRKLSWQNRIRIASEMCSALIFLHSVGKNGIVHGDLKPQNILLDSSFVCKIIDFGISRELHKSDETLTPFHATEFPKFTRGYVDPEFLSNYELTPQYDVYSYGIILLQLITGRAPQGIRDYVDDIIEKNDQLDKLVDSSAGNWPIEETKKLALLCLRCTEQSRKKRPELASEVWSELESMKDVAYKLQLENSLKEKATPELEITNFSREELAAATNNFDESLKIANLFSAIYYKGFLHHTTVVIKVFRHEKDFNDEVEALSLGKVNHPNIVLFIGASPETRATVHEYLPNGSLYTYLPYNKLPWQDRIRIASEICSALIFLHSRHIAHGHLRLSHVLLDSNLVSKLQFHPNSLSFIFHLGENPGSDVFAFGTILLQLVTGNVDLLEEDWITEVELAVENKKLDKYLDSSAGKWPIEEAMKMAELGLACWECIPSDDESDDEWKTLEDVVKKHKYLYRAC